MNRALSRRSILIGATGAAAAACIGGSVWAYDVVEDSSARADGVLRIGFVSPTSGDSSAFGSVNGYLLSKVRGALTRGLTSGGKKYDIEIIDRDSESDPQQAARLAADLIGRHRVDLMLCTSTPETVNPVSDVCEKAGVPCLSTAVPWESWFYGRGATAAKPFRYTYHFFVGADEIHTAYSGLWHEVG